MEIRCDNGILFGVIEEEDRDGVVTRVLEVKCRSRRCGHEAGAVVLHRFDLETGNIQGTLKFKDPVTRKESRNAAGKYPAIRSA